MTDKDTCSKDETPEEPQCECSCELKDEEVDKVSAGAHISKSELIKL